MWSHGCSCYLAATMSERIRGFNERLRTASETRPALRENLEDWKPVLVGSSKASKRWPRASARFIPLESNQSPSNSRRSQVSATTTSWKPTCTALLTKDLATHFRGQHSGALERQVRDRHQALRVESLKNTCEATITASLRSRLSAFGSAWSTQSLATTGNSDVTEAGRHLLERLAAEGKATRLLDEELATAKALEADGLLFLVGLTAVDPEGSPDQTKRISLRIRCKPLTSRQGLGRSLTVRGLVACRHGPRTLFPEPIDVEGDASAQVKRKEMPAKGYRA